MRELLYQLVPLLGAAAAAAQYTVTGHPAWIVVMLALILLTEQDMIAVNARDGHLVLYEDMPCRGTCRGTV